MKTKKINIYEQQMKWERWHIAAGATIEVEKRSGRGVRAIYQSPLDQWKDHIDPLGEVCVPDMEYYNALIDVRDIDSAIKEILDD